MASLGGTNVQRNNIAVFYLKKIKKLDDNVLV